MSIDWPLFVKLISSAQRFVLISHVRPDCDALGSELGMAGVLESLGKHVRIVNPDPTPPNLKFIDPDLRIQQIGRDIQPAELHDADTFMILDTSAWGQLGAMGDVFRQSKAQKLVLDHHVSSDDLGAVLFKDPKAEATGRLVCDAAKQLGVKLTEPMAVPLLAAITTDTGWFRFPSTLSTTFHTAAELLEAGARPQQLYRHLFEQDSLARLHLLGRMLSKATMLCNGRLIYSSVLQPDFNEVGALSSETDDFINYLLRVRGTRVAVLFSEVRPQVFKVSFRSRGIVDCSSIAEEFSGGGHRAASGATLEGTWEEVQTLVLSTCTRAIDRAAPQLPAIV